jgi:hypothetical protein
MGGCVLVLCSFRFLKNGGVVDSGPVSFVLPCCDYKLLIFFLLFFITGGLDRDGIGWWMVSR